MRVETKVWEKKSTDAWDELFLLLNIPGRGRFVSPSRRVFKIITAEDLTIVTRLQSSGRHFNEQWRGDGSSNPPPLRHSFCFFLVSQRFACFFLFYFFFLEDREGLSNWGDTVALNVLNKTWIRINCMID